LFHSASTQWDDGKKYNILLYKKHRVCIQSDGENGKRTKEKYKLKKKRENQGRKMLLYVIDIDGFEMKKNRERESEEKNGKTGKNLYGREHKRSSNSSEAQDEARMRRMRCWWRWKKKPKMSYD
jgi:hypothetical protein